MKSPRILLQSIATLLTLVPWAAPAVEDILTGTGGATQPGVSWAPVTAAGGTVGVWTSGAGTIPGATDNVVIAATGLIDIRGSAAIWPTHSTEIQDLAFNSSAAVTLNNNSSSQDMLLILNGGRGALLPLISAVGDFAYTIQGPGSNATAHPLRLQLKASGDISVAANVLTISAELGETGAQALRKTGAGTLVLSGANTFTGGLTLSTGILRATGNAGALGLGTLTLAGAELQLTNDTALAFNRNTLVTGNTQITSNRATAGVGVTQTLGTLSIGGQTLTIAAGANSTSGTAGLAFGATTLTGGAIFNVNTGAGLTLGAMDVGANPLTVTGVGVVTITGAVSAGGSGLVKAGTGRAIVAGVSTLATGVTVTNGVLEATNNGALGTGAVVVTNGGTLELNLAGSLFTAASITANAGGRVAVRGLTTNSAVTLAGGILGTRTADAGIFAGPVSVTADSSVQLLSYSTPANNQTLTIAGKLSGASALNVTGNGGNAGLKALILTNTANDFSGVFNVAVAQRLTSLPTLTGNTLGTAAVNLTGGFLRLNDNGAGLDGTLAYGNNLIVGAGGGTLDLDRVSGNNTGNTFALGSLSLGGAVLTVNGANGYKASFTGGTLTGVATISNAGGVTIAGPVTGGFGLTKTGAGSLTLGGANTYSGATSITAGTLNLSGSIAGGLFLGDATTLSGAGTATGVVAVGNAAVLSPGNAGSGTLTAGGVTFGTGAADTATVNFTTEASPGNLNVTGLNSLALNGAAGSVALRLLSTLPAVGEHTIIDYSGALGGTGFAAFALAPLPNPRIAATLVNDTANTRVVLSVTAVDAPRWTGAVSGEWSTAALANPKNWKLVVGVGSTDYLAGDNALFDDQATGSTAVVLNVENVAPTSVVFDHSTAKSYSLSGTNGITGATGLVKTNNGPLTISNTNTFTGAVSIGGGTVSVNALADTGVGSPLGAGSAVTLSGAGTLEFTGATGSSNRAVTIGTGGGTVKVVPASVLTLGGAVTANGHFTLNNDGTATLSGALSGPGGADVLGSGTTTLSGAISSALAIGAAGTTTVSGNLAATSALTKTGTGTAILTGAANVPAAMTVSAGVLQIGNGVLPGSTGTATITNNAALAFNTPDTLTVTATTAIVGSGALTKTGLGTAVLNGPAANTFSGTTTVSGGNLILSKTTGVNAIGGNLVVELGGTVSYGTTAGQLADHIPDTASITLNGGIFGSGAGATLAAPTTGVADTVASVTVNSGSFLSGRGAGTVPVPFVVTGDFKVLGGTALVQRGGGLTANAVQLGAPGFLDLDGGSGTAGNLSRLSVGAGGLTLSGATINFNAGPSVVLAASVGSMVTLAGNVTSTGVSAFARLNPTLSTALVDLAAAERTFDVTGTLTVAPALQNGAVRKTNSGALVLTGTSTYADGTFIDGGTVSASSDAALGAATGGVTIRNGAILQAGGPITSNRAFALGPGGGGIDTNGETVTLGATSAVTGTTLTKTGAGTLTLAGTQSYLTLTTTGGTTAINSLLGNGSSSVIANAATHINTGQKLAALTIANGAVVTFGALPGPAPMSDEAVAFAVVPEPGSALLLLGGMGALLARRRRCVG